ncbi:AAA family ATPase [Elizabethkingia anophelis]|uniref:Reticulocyte binding-like protein 2b n=1 Tax=Elizabethkingia anophelis TaxID=1117645 RepID=A0A455ZEK8_9FLAO|nr:ATP-binding protein [Elizabethkingia anophelis]AKH95208.1 hypothetical protein M876_11585 [Elizabethkingia anophelis FMS-007]DAC75293.1 TPA_exp: reticulocyte binding-like protein 2b [Elizabethkingia anophelis]
MRNALSGYTYQQQITRLLIGKMDTEREISNIEIEAETADNFDDLILSYNNQKYHFQLKDFVEPSITKIKITDHECILNNKKHKLSSAINVLFFKKIAIQTNSEILGFPSQLIKGVHIVSLSRQKADDYIADLYQENTKRLIQIDSFFSKILDLRIWNIKREDLPSINTYNTELLEETIDVGYSILQNENLLLIEGKPGVGKSHLATLIKRKLKGVLIYRFWVHNQDPEYNERLYFKNFVNDISRKIFNNNKKKTLAEILEKISDHYSILIIDGLDHVENYNPNDLRLFIDAIEKLKNVCKVIVLSRPLATVLKWKKQTMANWNSTQTHKVLDELYHIGDIAVQTKIFKISQGYPILVRYIAEHYKIHNTIPELSQLTDIDEYYTQLFARQKGKQSLAIFLCSRSFFMESEIKIFLQDSAPYIEEFVRDYPYLFEIRLNRISLFHDSLNTYLRKINIANTELNNKVQRIVFESIMSLDKRFISRFSLFNLSKSQKSEIVKKCTNIDVFKLLVKNCIDYEALRLFYKELKAFIPEMHFSELEVINYYDLSLIENLTNRDQLSTSNAFYYSYVKSLLKNGFTYEDFTSSDYLFAMLYYIEQNNSILLFNIKNDRMGDVSTFVHDLESDLYKEENYISKHSRSITVEQIEKRLNNKIHFREHLTFIIENLYIHNINIKSYEELVDSIKKYVNGEESVGLEKLKLFLSKYDVSDHYPSWILENVKANLTSYGYSLSEKNNEYKYLSLKDLIMKYKNSGSYDLTEMTHNSIRLALYENRSIDISSIYLLWSKYFQRRDYSLFSIPLALHTLESKSLITKIRCVQIINEMQRISEKEHRALLLDFISFYEPTDIIPLLEREFIIEDLNIDWFQLPSKYLDVASDAIFYYQLFLTLKYHRSYPELKITEIENVITSKWFGEFAEVLIYKDYSILINRNHPLYNHIKNNFIKIIDDNSDDSISSDHSASKWDNGYIDLGQINYINDNNITSTNLAVFTDHGGCSLSEPQIFNIYPPSEIAANFKEILHNGICRRIPGRDYSAALYFWPGSVLYMINRFLDDKEFKLASKSFESFMQLSMFDLKLDQ